MNEGELDGQVGQSFSLDQMIADSKLIQSRNQLSFDHDPSAKHRKSVEIDVGKLGDDIALLVAYAEAQGYNLLDVLSRDVSNPTINIHRNYLLTSSADKIISVPASIFSSNLLQLSFKLSLTADESSRMELESATSESSLKSILELCRDEQGEIGNPSIDIKYFLKLCKKKYSMLTEGLDDDDAKEPLQDLSFVLSTNTFKPRYDGDSKDISHGGREASSLSEISRIAATPSKIDASPAPRKTFGGADSPIKIPSETILVPSSPYDEEVLFSDVDDEEEGTEPLSNFTRELLSRNQTEKTTDKSSSDLAVTSSRAERSSTRIENFSAQTELSQKIQLKDGLGQHIKSEEELEEKLFGSSPNKKAIERLRSHSNPKPKRTSQYPMHSKAEQAEPEDVEKQLTFMQEMIEENIRSTVSQTDLYHKIQVHLGFIDAYTMIPPRGEIVISQPRAWLSIRDIISAFEAGRCKLNAIQVQILLVMINHFAQEIRLLEKSSAVYQSIDHKKPLTQMPVVKKGPKLNALWLKKYLASLRLLKRSKSPVTPRSTATLATSKIRDTRSNQLLNDGVRSQSADVRKRASSVSALSRISSSTLNENIRRKSLSNSAQNEAFVNAVEHDDHSPSRAIPIQWEEWLGTKVLDDKLKREEKPKEFRRALAGLSTTLTKEEINNMLLKFQIIPDEILDDEIRLRVKRWALDIDGRRDFRHDINLEIQKLQVKEKLSFNKLSKDKRRSILQSLKQKLIAMKSEELKLLESKEQAITLELFWKYRNECEEMKYQGTGKWGDWLKSYRSKADEALDKIEVGMVKRMQLSKQEAKLNEALIPIQDLASAVDTAATTGGVPLPNALELRKSFVALKKEFVKQSALGDGHGLDNYAVLVSKSAVNKHLGFVISPIFTKLADDLKGLADRARRSHDDLLRAGSSKFFHDRKEAASRAVELEAESTLRKSDSFKKWLKMKEEEKLKATQSAVCNE